MFTRQDKFYFNGEEIDFSHPVFSVIVFDTEKQMIIESPSEDELLAAYNAKAQYLIESGQVSTEIEKNISKRGRKKNTISSTDPADETIPSIENSTEKEGIIEEEGIIDSL